MIYEKEKQIQYWNTRHIVSAPHLWRRQSSWEWHPGPGTGWRGTPTAVTAWRGAWGAAGGAGRAGLTSGLPCLTHRPGPRSASDAICQTRKIWGRISGKRVSSGPAATDGGSLIILRLRTHSEKRRRKNTFVTKREIIQRTEWDAPVLRWNWSSERSIKNKKIITEQTLNYLRGKTLNGLVRFKHVVIKVSGRRNAQILVLIQQSKHNFIT